MDASGKPANLAKADFFKVYTAQQQQCGWIGETSTEVCGAEDLHPDAVPGSGITEIAPDSSEAATPDAAAAVYYTLQGVRVASPAPGATYIRLTAGGAQKVRL